MTSEKQRAANRRNAQLSTGPRTARGKAIVRQNALKHGLARPIGADPAYAGAAEALRRELASARASPVVDLNAAAAAEAQFELIREREAEMSLIQRYLDQQTAAIQSAQGSNSVIVADQEQFISAFRRLKRYERRAQSRLARSLDVLMRASGGGEQH